jgi:hypothetical protein
MHSPQLLARRECCACRDRAVVAADTMAAYSSGELKKMLAGVGIQI